MYRMKIPVKPIQVTMPDLDLELDLKEAGGLMARIIELENRVTAIEQASIEAAAAEEKACQTSPWMVFRGKLPKQNPGGAP